MTTPDYGIKCGGLRFDLREFHTCFIGDQFVVGAMNNMYWAIDIL